MFSQRSALQSSGPNFARPLIVLGLITFYGIVVAAAAGKTGAFFLAVPLAFVATIWALPLGISMVNGARWPLMAFTACLIVFADGAFRVRGCDDFSIDWQVLAKVMVWLVAGGITFLNLPKLLPYLRHPHIALATLFVALIPISALWSVDPVYAFSSGIFHLCVLGFVFSLIHHIGERWTVTIIVVGVAMLVVPSLAMSPFTTSFGGISECRTGELDRIQGLTGHPVALASLCAKLVIGVIYLLEKRWIGRVLGFSLLVIAVVTIVLTQSRMAPLAMVVATILTFVIRARIFGLATQFAAIPLIILTLLVLALGIDQIISQDFLRVISRSGRPEEILTLSGRSEIWAFVLERVSEAPILGFGQGAGPTVLLTGFQGWALVHAHNVYLQTLLCLGLVGLGLMVAAILVQLHLAVVHQRTFALYVVLYLAFFGITETSFVYNLPDTNFIFWALAIFLTLPPNMVSDGAANEEDMRQNLRVV